MIMFRIKTFDISAQSFDTWAAYAVLRTALQKYKKKRLT